MLPMPFLVRAAAKGSDRGWTAGAAAKGSDRGWTAAAGARRLKGSTGAPWDGGGVNRVVTWPCGSDIICAKGSLTDEAEGVLGAELNPEL